MPGGAEQRVQLRRARGVAANAGQSARGRKSAGTRSSSSKKGTHFGQYVVDWIQFSLCDQMLARLGAAMEHSGIKQCRSDLVDVIESRVNHVAEFIKVLPV
ncbi:unnamed protein product [Urochloa humidicola]